MTPIDPVALDAYMEAKRHAIWCIMPVLGARDYTETAITDLLAQSVPTRILIINQGVDTPFREHLERLAEQNDDRVFLWNHDPCLPSLSASWNTGLKFAWATGTEQALVVNNDVRLHPMTVEALVKVLTMTESYFVSCVGVREPDFHMDWTYSDVWEAICGDIVNNMGIVPPRSRGGPDFSCFLISKEGHDRYPFDENFIPAYCEDLDTHRRYMLGGDGDKIFSVNLPYLHYASGTLKSMTESQRMLLEARINSSRGYYAKKWGGPVNQERFTIPFDEETAQDGVTTPDLQFAIQGGFRRAAEISHPSVEVVLDTKPQAPEGADVLHLPDGTYGET